MDSLARRVKSRCCGLLEFRYLGKAFDGLYNVAHIDYDVSIDDLERLPMAYLHRTIHEFIVAEDVWQVISDLTKDMQFSIPARLASACILAMKLAKKIHSPTHRKYVDTWAHACGLVAVESPLQAHAYLMELDRLMSALEILSRQNLGGPPLDIDLPAPHWTTAFLPSTLWNPFSHGPESYGSIYTWAAVLGLLVEPMPLPTSLDDQTRFFIVTHALSSWPGPQVKGSMHPPEHRCTTLEYLLDRLMHPENEACGASLWHLAMVHCHKLQQDRRLMEIARLLKILLSATKHPCLLWRQPLKEARLSWSFSGIKFSYVLESVDHVPLLGLLRQHLYQSGTQEDIKLVNEIQRLTERVVDNYNSV